MFELTEEESKVVKLGPRDEKHGDSDVLAVDVYIHVIMANTALAMFAPTLRSALFFRRDTTQGELVDDGHLPDVRFPEMKKISWHVVFRHTKLTIHHGTKRAHDIVFEDCTLDRFKFEPRKNGQVLIAFRAQVHPTEEEGARLLAILGKVVEVSIADGEEDEDDGDMFGRQGGSADDASDSGDNGAPAAGDGQEDVDTPPAADAGEPDAAPARTAPAARRSGRRARAAAVE